MIHAAYGIAQRGRYIHGNSGPTKQCFEFQKEKGICNAITTISKDSMVIVRMDIPKGTGKEYGKT